jgi:hypothetical protein
MRGPRPFRIFLMGILVLTPLAQAFWCVWAWRLIGARRGIAVVAGVTTGPGDSAGRES